ncbi:ABC-2 type transport system ATP-binding protein [Clostridium collagenovorans DSM 3089]|uniref:ABC-2 type transport system ATP-binding protein n=1 Tax=Clostridium collagenovorans DSM 3089 TaxID=1121306 RepID=A0A1M5V4U3_9CLOT|nr:ABC transporter ATP-binding protein [Clostridium collagenovorans]SHH70277.1 ABC-2 type transport system ATP-binding protein [Clostridium collagenovorans DSM 3089]
MIKLTNINKSYKEKRVLNNLNLQINKGEIIGLLAPNAEGKSTLLKIIGGHISMDSGEYTFNGETFNHTHKEFIGYMNDSSIIPSYWRIKHSIEYYRNNFNTFNEKKCMDILEKFKLDLDRKIKSLSKGESEKLHLALSISVEGQLYIMDEPLAAIDLIGRDDVIKMILENFSLDSSIIIASHLVSDIEKMLDRVILLRDGEIIENVLVEDLRSNGKSVVSFYREVYGNA